MSDSPAAPGLTGRDLEVWAAVATLLERLPAALDAQLLRDSGMTHFEHGLMYALTTAPGRALRMSTLAAYASCTLSRLSRAISRLESRGWVRRAADPDDRRATLAVLTVTGETVVAQATPAHQALVERLVFEPLDSAQVHQLGIIARRIALAVDPAEPWSPGV